MSGGTTNVKLEKYYFIMNLITFHVLEQAKANTVINVCVKLISCKSHMAQLQCPYIK